MPANCWFMVEDIAFNSICPRLLGFSLCLPVEIIEVGSTLCENNEKAYLWLGSILSLVLINEPLFLLNETDS